MWPCWYLHCLSCSIPLRPPHPPQFSAVGGEERGHETVEDSKGPFVVNGIELEREKTRRARVLYDYEAVNDKEITVYCNQVHTHTHTHTL